MVDDVAHLAGVIGAGVAVVALVLAIVALVRLRRVRADQRILLPDGARADLANRQATLQRAVDAVEAGLRELEEITRTQAERTESELASSLRFQGLVRYDAYTEMGGRQSWSIALLDGHGTGAVISCLHARDHARVYMKEIVEGVAGQRLSPEEERAIAIARGTEAPPAPPQPAAPDGPAEEEAAP